MRVVLVLLVATCLTVMAGCFDSAGAPSSANPSSPRSSSGNPSTGGSTSHPSSSGGSSSQPSSGSSSSGTGSDSSSQSSSGDGNPPPTNDGGAPAPVNATCGLSTTAGNSATGCSSGPMNSTTGASFSAGSVTLEFTGTAATGLTFNVYNATGGVIGTVTGTASPLSITLDPGAIPSGPSVTLSADAHADTLFVNWAGTVTFHLS